MSKHGAAKRRQFFSDPFHYPPPLLWTKAETSVHNKRGGHNMSPVLSHWLDDSIFVMY